MIGYPEGSKPQINWTHVDGPMLTSACGRVRWLTLRERFLHFIGLLSEQEILDTEKP